jgi:hypothetical protein
MYFYLAQYSIICFLGLIDPKKISNKIYYLVYFFLLITIGFRYQVGGDWGTYLQNYRNLALDEMGISTFIVREPGWLLLSYVSKSISTNEIYPLNLMCAVIFLLGIKSLCAGTKRKFFALAISYPILIILVGMGYTRQSVAIGFCFLSLKYIYLDKDRWKFILLTILAITFHNTALFFSAVFYLLNREIKFSLITLAIILLIVLVVAYTPLGIHFYNMINEYIFLADYRASGAVPRGIPIFIASLGFLTLAKYVAGSLRLNRYISLISVVIFTYMLLIAQYAALDRIYIYFSFIYVVFLANLEINKYSYGNLIYESLVLIIFFIYTVVWFTYGVNYSFWVPYDNYLKYLFL